MAEVPFAKLGTVFSKFSNAAKQAGITALNTTAFIARKKLIENIDKKFNIDSPWVAKGVFVNKAKAEQSEPVAEVFHRYFGLAQIETGDKRVQTKNTPWIIPTQAGKKWLKDAGFKNRPPGLKRLLRTEVGGRKPFFVKFGTTSKGKGKSRRVLKPEDIPKKKSVPIWTRTGDTKHPIKLLFTAYTDTLKMPTRPWFRQIVESVYDSKFNKIFNKEYKKNLTNAIK